MNRIVGSWVCTIVNKHLGAALSDNAAEAPAGVGFSDGADQEDHAAGPGPFLPLPVLCNVSSRL